MEPREWHYTYYSYELDGRGYIGKRTSRVPPDDDPYMGSFSDKTFKPTHKIILGVFDSAKQALRAETAVQNLFGVNKDPQFANKVIYSSGNFGYLPKSNDWDNRPNEKEMKENARKLHEIENSLPSEWIEECQILIGAINQERYQLMQVGQISDLCEMYLLRSPYGTVFPVVDLNGFCDTFQLNFDAIQQVLTGELASWKNWTKGNP